MAPDSSGSNVPSNGHDAPPIGDFVLDGGAAVVAPPRAFAAGGPIADLSYRNYDGPLHNRANRWWIIAVSRIRYLRVKWWFWLFIAFSILPYLFTTVLLYFFGSNAALRGPNNPFFDNTVGQKYAVHFMRSLEWQGFWLFCIAVMTGAGAISSDNRSNALLVYLSKPVTKADYLLGKWMSTFLLGYLVALVPALLFYVYCLLSYYSDGFLREEPWLLFRFAAACAVPAAIHASLLTGTSAWSKNPVIAGATYAGIYFVSSIIANVCWVIMYRGDLTRGMLVQHLSVGGIIGGINQNIFGVTIHTAGIHRHRGFEMLSFAPPNLWAMLGIGAGLCFLGIVAARMRIRAVEVVTG